VLGQHWHDKERLSDVTAIPTSWFLLLSAVLFVIGAGGVLIRRNVLVVLMCVEIMMNAVNLAFIALPSPQLAHRPGLRVYRHRRSRRRGGRGVAILIGLNRPARDHGPGRRGVAERISTAYCVLRAA